MAQITDLEKQQLLSQILKSPEFYESKRYQELLQYLVDKSTSGGPLKEVEIAHEFFGKDPSFDPGTDPLIRSYISNLRKKLEHYYLTTEDQFDFRLDIPKGQYLVTYAPTAPRVRPKGRLFRSTVLYLTLIALLVLVSIYREISRETPVESKATAVNPIWTEFLQPGGHPILVVVGDYRFLSEKGKSEGRTFLRDPKINSEKDLRAFTGQNPKKYDGLEISTVSYVGQAGALGLPILMQVLGGASDRVSIRLSSELKWDDFDNHCVVFLGSLKTLNKLDTVLSRTNIRYGLGPNTLAVLSGAKGDAKAFNLAWRGGNYQRDYSIVLKLNGPSNNPMVLLTGFSELGIMDAVKSAADPGLMTRIREFQGLKTLQAPFLFEMVSEAEGVGYTVFRSRIEHFEVLDYPKREMK